MKERELYEQGMTIYEIAKIVNISPTGVYKRLNNQGVELRRRGTRNGSHWSIDKRGEEFLGADGRIWVRGISSTKKRNSKRRAVVVMEEKLGHPIPKGYVVHHIDGDRTNDVPENLTLMTRSEHSRLKRK